MNHKVERLHGDLLAEIGGIPDECGVCLAIYGDSLITEEVSTRLGVRPSSAHRKGEARRPGAPPHPTGAWILEIRGDAPTSPESLARALLLRLPGDPVVSASLRERFSIQLRFGVHFSGWNKGFHLSADVVSRVSEIGAEIVFDLYAYDESGSA